MKMGKTEGKDGRDKKCSSLEKEPSLPGEETGPKARIPYVILPSTHICMLVCLAFSIPRIKRPLLQSFKLDLFEFLCQKERQKQWCSRSGLDLQQPSMSLFALFQPTQPSRGQSCFICWWMKFAVGHLNWEEPHSYHMHERWRKSVKPELPFRWTQTSHSLNPNTIKCF